MSPEDLLIRLSLSRTGGTELSGLVAVASGVAEAANSAYVKMAGDDIYSRVMPYSESVDAALTLIPADWALRTITIDERNVNFWLCFLDATGSLIERRVTVVGGRGATIPLAICDAAIRSLKSPDSGGAK